MTGEFDSPRSTEMAPDTRALRDRLRQLLGPPVPQELDLEWREWRWMALLPRHVVFVAGDDQGWRRLRREAQVMERARGTVGAAVPAVVVEDDAFRLHVRERRDGLHGHGIEARVFGIDDQAEMPPAPRFARDCPLTEWGRRFAVEFGRTFARLHATMTDEAGRAIGLRPYVVDWDRVEDAVARHVDVDVVKNAVPRVRAWDEARRGPNVVIHGDPHLYNIFASEAGRLNGLIDFGDCAIGDRHEDLRYVHSEGPEFAKMAIAAYQEQAGVEFEEDRVARFHVRSAVDHFVWIPPTAERFPKIVEWATAALVMLTPEWT